jgi:hypothetical protein
MVTQLIPFYTFQKAMFRILVALPNEHPIASALLMQVGLMQQQYLRQQLHGALPDAYVASDTIRGHLTQLDKLNPLLDAWKIATPEGLAASGNPFVKLLAQYALHSPSYGAGAGMDANGNLVPQPDLLHSILNTYTGAVPGLGKPLGLQSLNPIPSGLSDAQLAALNKRITKAQTAQATVGAGGYLVTDALKPKASTAASGWGIPTKSSTRSGGINASRLSSRIVASSRIRAPRTYKKGRTYKVRTPRSRTIKLFGKVRTPRATTPRIRTYRPRIKL